MSSRANPRYPKHVPIRLFDTLTQSSVDFVPRVPGQVGIYVCGPTVQSAPHIGHLRSALAYDLWRRWFTYRGLNVTLVRNVTDIDDKILAVATGEEWWALAYRIEDEFRANAAALGIQAPTYEPRATGHIGEMHGLIALLIERGHAYAATDGSGDVYFDVQSWPDYGQLTRQSPDAMVDDAAAPDRGKRDPRDFALWKGRKNDEPATASWESPWGAGRPGWHIECSAMATKYLGESFDIHGGGLDLRFPHHENELAQSRAAGHGFANTWLHNGLVTVAGQKMSKSIGNVILAADILRENDPLTVRYFLAASHYRSVMDVHDGSLAEAKAAWDRIRGFLERAAAHVSPAEVPAAFAAAMDDDLSVPAALAVLHDAVRAGNTALESGNAAETAARASEVAAMVDVLGLTPGAETDGNAYRDALGTLIERLLAERHAARERKDWAVADRIRDDFESAGIVLEDGTDHTRWSING
ncbi:cysteinyl-tRNA synthetase [Microbacteriaceae bacterium MWH-Ta3]|nr:cysteinyl-tRNA synthetase [Microbacteriaceae bacterium MWH-Ta3]